MVRQDPKVILQLGQGVGRQKATTACSALAGRLGLSEPAPAEHAEVAFVALLTGRAPAVLAGANDEPVGCLF